MASGSGVAARVSYKQRADHGGENVGVAELMFSVCGTDNNNFIAGNSVHNQRTETCSTSATSCTYSAASTVLLPHFQASLDVFSEAWANRPIRTEQNLTPYQLWEVGQALNPVPDPDPKGTLIPETEWEESGYTNESHPEVIVPALDSLLSDPEMMQLQDNIDPLQHSECFGVDIYLNTVQYVENLLEAR